MRKRLFVAIPLPNAVKDALDEVRKHARVKEARWTPKENLHITVYFIGWVEDSRVPEVAERMRRVCAGTSPFALTFQEAVFGPPQRTPYMVWGIFEENTRYETLARAMGSALNELSGEEDTRKPIPHVTLARFTHPFLPHVKLHQPKIAPFEISSCELMESHLSRSGPTYTILESFSFGK